MSVHNTIITVDGLWKRYGLGIRSEIRKLISGSGQHPTTPDPREAWALQDINLEIRRGETVGIIGQNGAGKSTLLKVLARVTKPTHGRADYRGRVFPMIELNAGLNPELTGRENVYLLGAIMSLTRHEIQAKLSEIEEFCDLREWFDEPVRKYSTGMVARLGFGVAMNVQADILLVDEVLAVGDLAFQRKCFDRMEAMRRENVTILFVSHNIRQVERICSRAILLHTGKMLAQGNTGYVCDRYFMEIHSKIRQQVEDAAQEYLIHESSGELEITSVDTLNASREPCTVFAFSEPLIIRVTYRAKDQIHDPVLGIDLFTTDMLHLAGFNNRAQKCEVTLKGEGVFECCVERLTILPGVFTIGMKIKSGTNRVIYQARNMATFQVSSGDELRNTSFGLMHLDTKWYIEPGLGHNH